MADQTFIEATMEEVQDPDAWDAGGAALGGSEEAWKHFWILLAKKNAGTLDASMALTLDNVAKYVAAVAETLSTRVRCQ